MNGTGDTRDSILSLLRDYPGLHVREIARQLGTSAALVEYHVERLLEQGTAREERRGAYQHLYPVTTGDLALSPRDRAWLAAMRHTMRAQIVLQVLAVGGVARHKEIAEALGIGKSKLSFHLRTLEQAKVIQKTSEGFALIDAPHLETLLRTHKPIPEQRSEFGRLWLDFYGD